MTEPATIRAARPDELDHVLAMYEWLFEPPGPGAEHWDPERGREALREAIASERAAVLVADGADRGLIGFCTAYLDLRSVRFGLRCWVEDLAVDPGLRSRGLGSALLESAREWARARGATHLELDSSEARTGAHRFYQRQQPAWRSISYAWRTGG